MSEPIDFLAVSQASKSEARCILKRAYATKKNALTAKSRLRAHEGKTMKIYKCPHCKNFHLTTDNQTGNN